MERGSSQRQIPHGCLVNEMQKGDSGGLDPLVLSLPYLQRQSLRPNLELIKPMAQKHGESMERKEKGNFNPGVPFRDGRVQLILHHQQQRKKTALGFSLWLSGFCVIMLPGIQQGKKEAWREVSSSASFFD